MQKNKYIHIGFGKCGSSKLQRDIFPKIAKIKGLKYWGDEFKSNSFDRENLNRLLLNHVTKMELGYKVQNLKIDGNYLISNEELSSYRDAELIDEFSFKNLIAFGKDSHIILIIREPRNWLSSIYIQMCLHEKPLQSPNNFFLDDNEYSLRLPNVKFNIDKFSYKKIINAYKEKFNRFTFIKFEKIQNMQALGKIFELNDNDLQILKKSFKSSTVNKGLSKFAFKLTWRFNTILSFFGLSFINKYSNHVYLLRSNNDFLKFDNKYNKPKIGNIFRKTFNYKNIFQRFLDRIIPYEKYILDFNNLKKIKIQNLENEYNDLPDYEIYIKE